MASLSNLCRDGTDLLAELCTMSGDTSGLKEDAKKEELKFYAVSFPDDLCSDIPAKDLIFTSKKDALEAIKKYSGARFKPFTSYDEAKEYSSKPLPNLEVQASFAEEKSPFKSISSQEMVSLRKTIETGDEVSFLDKVWSNPRYLINCNGDGPTVLQEGTRYHALHVAARFKKTNMCLIILNTLHDVGFISELFPKENPPKLRERIKRLVDLYLNTPDKSLSETPLHFACKFGADGVLSILLSFPECDVNKRNKYGVLAREMVCDRVAASPGLKEKMLLMFEDLFYVPVLRDVANKIWEPVIGEPCRSNIVLQATSGSFSSCSEQKKTLRYCAFAGPMSQSSAEKFYTVFSKKKFEEHLSYTPEQKKQLVDICRSDSEKGLERVGRKLAKTFDTSWIEYWPKLKFWGDMSSREGLEFLENHLKSQDGNTDVSLSALDLQARCDNFSNLIINFVEEFVRKLPQFLNNKNKITFFVLFQSLLPYTFCMSKSSFSDEDQLFLIHHEIGHLLYLKLVENSSESFEAIKLYINTQFINMYNFINNSPFKEHNQWKMFLCVLKYACYCQSSNILALKPPSCDCNWIVEKSSYDYSSSMCYFSILKLKQSYFRHQNGDDLCSSEQISGVCTVFPASLNAKEEPSPASEKELKLNGMKSDGCEIEQDTFEVAKESFSEYCDISEVFVTTVDKFCLTFSSVISELSDSVPFTSPETFFTVFQEVMPFFRPLCEFNFSQKCIPDFYHNQMALTILEKIRDISFDVLVRWRNYFMGTDILYCKSCDLHQFGISNTRECLHLLCVMKHVFVLNFHLIKSDEPEIEREESKSFCRCEFGLEGVHLGINPHHCLNWLKFLQNKYKVNVLDLAPLQFLSLSSDEEEENGDVFFTPPESPLPFEKEIFVDGSEFTDIDIDVLRAIVDDGVSISRAKYPNIYYWKTAMESKLGSFLNPEDKLSCTPASSSASVRRAVTPLQRARRTLF